LALKPGWPSMFRGYLNEEERYRKCFAGGWYLTGDLAMRDVDGYYWFVGRTDDVIKSAGHLIGPFEVESALMEHPAVAEAGVIGKPDPVIGAVVKAFVALKPGYAAERRFAARNCSAMRASAWAPPSRRRRSISATRCLGREAARSCVDFSARRSWAFPKAICRPSRTGVMTEHGLKPHLTREHVLELLRQMLRVRRFEEKCAELYQREKIRGFLHLYIGEEASPSASCRPWRFVTRSSPPIASTATRCCAACPPMRSWPRCTASLKAAVAAAAGRCIFSMRRRASMAAMRSSPADCRSRSVWRWRRR